MIILLVIDGKKGDVGGKESVVLVPTKKLRSLNVFTQFGVGNKPSELEIYAKRDSRRFNEVVGKNFRAIPAREVGLEWHNHGKKMKESDGWMKQSWIMVSDKAKKTPKRRPKTKKV